jgi:hypothetical protein
MSASVYERFCICAYTDDDFGNVHIQTTHIRMTASVNAHIRKTHIRKRATSIMASYVYARFRICMLMYMCASIYAHLRKLSSLNAHLYASSIYAHIQKTPLWKWSSSVYARIQKHTYMEDAIMEVFLLDANQFQRVANLYFLLTILLFLTIWLTPFHPTNVIFPRPCMTKDFMEDLKRFI